MHVGNQIGRNERGKRDIFVFHAELSSPKLLFATTTGIFPRKFPCFSPGGNVPWDKYSVYLKCKSFPCFLLTLFRLSLSFWGETESDSMAQIGLENTKVLLTSLPES